MKEERMGRSDHCMLLPVTLEYRILTPHTLTAAAVSIYLFPLLLGTVANF